MRAPQPFVLAVVSLLVSACQASMTGGLDAGPPDAGGPLGDDGSAGDAWARTDSGSPRDADVSVDGGSSPLDSGAWDGGSSGGDPCGRPHEPSGFRVVSERAFDALSEDGWGNRTDAAFTIEPDATAPCSPPNVGVALFAARRTGGTGPIQTGLPVRPGADQLYISFWLKLSPNWQGHRSGVNKIFHFWVGSGASHGNHVLLSAQGIGDGALYAQVRFQGMVPNAMGQVSYNGSTYLDRGAAEIVRGRWHHWEVLLVSNEPGSVDGEAHLWIDGTKVYERIGDTGYVPSGSNNLFDQVSWNPTWGGTGDMIVEDQTMEMDHAYVSVP